MPSNYLVTDELNEHKMFSQLGFYITHEATRALIKRNAWRWLWKLERIIDDEALTQNRISNWVQVSPTPLSNPSKNPSPFFEAPTYDQQFHQPRISSEREKQFQLCKSVSRRSCMNQTRGNKSPSAQSFVKTNF